MTEKKSTTTFTYHDPGRTFDGSPYEAAGLSVEQTHRVMNLTKKAIFDTHIQARNAFMQRNLDLGGKPRGGEYEDSAEYKLLVALNASVEAAQKKLSALHRAVTYDPKNPPTEDE